MDGLGRSIKENPLAWGVGATIAVVAIYMGYDWVRTRNNNVPKVVRTVARAAPKVPAEPRGKLPWAIGDVNLWDNEDDGYCSGCSKKCQASNVTEPCLKCKERCPMNY